MFSPPEFFPIDDCFKNFISTIHAAWIAWYGVDPDVFTGVSSDHSSSSTSLKTFFLNLPVIKEAGLLTWTASTDPGRIKDERRTLETKRTTFISSGSPCGTETLVRVFGLF